MSASHPYPAGWYRFRYSHELARGRLVAGRFFGKPLVGFRTERGSAHVFDAHCRHLGAHFADGRVVGDELRCGFHGWRYDTEGQCTQIPFTDTIPNDARVKAYPVRERNGTVWFWHDSTGAAPGFEIPDVPEMNSADWKRGPIHREVVRAHIREPRENAVDVAHGPILHGKSFPLTPGTMAEVRGWEEDAERKQLRFELVNSIGPASRAREVVLRFELVGPGHLVMRSDLPIEMLYFVPNTPVDDERIVFTVATWVKRSKLPFVDSALVRLAMFNFLRGLREDYVIFDKKRYLNDPLLSDADGPIARMRRWLSQFDPRPLP
ncbi:MAG: (2Fe-2S)-binding protein [Planctomycetota bacterium]|nr:MAG: (2Fe-2S)-binding protein [Planctomycetota bacterium]